ncbi:UTP15 [Symbiodinium microadriaticum]|nr:UTP15 [Symbiodinium microadriaticum]
MTEFQRVKIKQFPKIQDRETSEAKYWRSYSVSLQEHLLGSPSCIDFNPVNNNQFIVTASSSVHLYESFPDRNQRSFTRFSGDAYSGKFRKDGKLIVAGDNSGTVKVFDTVSKSLLRQFQGHKLPTRATVWSSSGLHILSSSDDKSVRLWDLGTEESIWNCKSAHSDYVRSLCTHPSAQDVFVSGSYDHSLKMWDARQRRSTMDFQHGHPVEHSLMAPSGTILFSAGSNEIKMWDLLSGRLMHTFCNHQKNVTNLCVDGTRSRLLSCGLDGHVKVFNLEGLQMSFGMKFDQPVLSLGLASDNRKLVVGFVNSDLEVRTRGEDSVGSLGLSREDDAQEGSSRQQRFFKGAGATVHKTYGDMVETERAVRLRPFEVQLKKFNYQQALDTALKTRNPLVVVTVLEELCRRSGLTIALSGRDEVTLDPILAFCSRYVSHSRYTRLIVQVAHRILDLYGCVLGQSDAIDELFHKLRQQVKVEMQFHRQAMKVMGALDEIISTSTLSQASSASSAEVQSEATDLI